MTIRVTDRALPATAPTATKQATREEQAARKAAREFEGLLVGMMMKSMRATVKTDKLTGGGQGEETFRSFLDEEYAKALVAQGGVGLAGTIERSILEYGKNSRSVTRHDQENGRDKVEGHHEDRK